MGELRWVASGNITMTLDQIKSLAWDVASAIYENEYDGYKARDQMLAAMIALQLCELTDAEDWFVYSEEETDDFGTFYKVWVKRATYT